MFCEPGKEYPITFRSFTIGTYVIAENFEGIVDTLYREELWTAEQCADKFGVESLHPKMQKVLADEEKSGGVQKKWTILHCIYPRKKKSREEGKSDAPNKPWASQYVDPDNKHIIEDGGYDEKPFFCARYDKYGDAVYGSCPSWKALPDSRQLNFLVKVLDNLAEVKANPRMLIPVSHEGYIDLRAGGATYVRDESLTSGAKPQEWMTQGDYAIGLDREERKAKAIEDAFFVSLFQLFANLDKGNMTAREVAERAGEKLNMFVPAFLRKTQEFFNPLLTRVWGLMLREGLFPPPPAEAGVVDPATGIPFIEDPDITYSSQVALVVQAAQNVGFARTMEMFGPLLEARPEAMDNFRVDRIVRDGARNAGLPADWMEDEDEVEATRMQRAEIIAQQQQQAQQQQLLDTATKVKNDSPAGNILNMAAA
jgi:hypothetical protein